MNEIFSVSTYNLMFKFLILVLQVSSNGDPLYDVGLPVHTHWNPVLRNPLTCSLRFHSLFSYLPAGKKYFYSCVYIIQVNKLWLYTSKWFINTGNTDRWLANVNEVMNLWVS